MARSGLQKFKKPKTKLTRCGYLFVVGVIMLSLLGCENANEEAVSPGESETMATADATIPNTEGWNILIANEFDSHKRWEIKTVFPNKIVDDTEKVDAFLKRSEINSSEIILRRISQDGEYAYVGNDFAASIIEIETGKLLKKMDSYYGSLSNNFSLYLSLNEAEEYGIKVDETFEETSYVITDIQAPSYYFYNGLLSISPDLKHMVFINSVLVDGNEHSDFEMIEKNGFHIYDINNRQLMKTVQFDDNGDISQGRLEWADNDNILFCRGFPYFDAIIYNIKTEESLALDFYLKNAIMSPDGKYLAFSRYKEEEVLAYYNKSEKDEMKNDYILKTNGETGVFIKDMETGEIRKLSDFGNPVCFFIDDVATMEEKRERRKH